MRIGIVCPYDLGAPGGVQQICLDLAERLRSVGDEVLVIGPGHSTRAGGPGRDTATIPVGRPTAIKANDSVVPLSLAPASWLRVRRALKTVDVVHIHEPLVPVVGWAALSAAKPRVVTFHADVKPWVSRAYRLAPWLRGRMRNSRLTAVSQTARRAIPESWGEATIIPNAVDVASFRVPTGRIRKRVVFLGRDEPRKGLDNLLAAWAVTMAERPDAELIVMGADRGGTARGVRYLGRVTAGEKNRMLASSTIFVAPNTGGESFGIVLVEAMAAGCAVIASDLEAFRSVVGSDGLLVGVGDVDALASAMSRLLGDDEEVDRLSTAGQLAVKRFDWSAVTGDYRRAYRDAIANR